MPTIDGSSCSRTILPGSDSVITVSLLTASYCDRHFHLASPSCLCPYFPPPVIVSVGLRDFLCSTLLLFLYAIDSLRPASNFSYSLLFFSSSSSTSPSFHLVDLTRSPPPPASALSPLFAPLCRWWASAAPGVRGACARARGCPCASPLPLLPLHPIAVLLALI